MSVNRSKSNRICNNCETSVSKTIGFIGVRNDSNSVWVDTKDSRIVRIKPLHFNAHQKAEKLNPWTLNVRGKTLPASLKSLVSPLNLSYRKKDLPAEQGFKKYPLLTVSNHGRWRVYAQHDDISWLHEIETRKIKGPDGYACQPVWVNPVDAAKRGIEHGDIVKIFNEKGAVMAGAYVTDRIVPDAISIDHGARYDPMQR